MTALVQRFVTHLPLRHERSLNAAELKEAEWWVRSIQRNTFAREYWELFSEGTVIYKGQLILFLNNDHFICCKVRLNQSDLPTSMKTQFCSQQNIDLQRFWLRRDTMPYIIMVHQRLWQLWGKGIGLLRVVRWWRKWYNGVLFVGGTMANLPSPVVPDLPAERVSKAPSFSTTGIDYAGPLYIRSTSSKECNSKVNICYSPAPRPGLLIWN